MATFKFRTIVWPLTIGLISACGGGSGSGEALPVNQAPTAGDLGTSKPRSIAPGDASRSVLVARMARRDAFAMPPIASSVPDAEGGQLLRACINSLTTANCQ
jgi:hypothetical protein